MAICDVDLLQNIIKPQLNEYAPSKLLGLDKSAYTSVLDGVTGAFLDWYAQYNIANLAVLKGEYPANVTVVLY